MAMQIQHVTLCCVDAGIVSFFGLFECNSERQNSIMTLLTFKIVAKLLFLIYNVSYHLSLHINIYQHSAVLDAGQRKKKDIYTFKM